MRKILLATLLLLPAASWAQNTFSADADFLTRGELRSGGLPPSEVPRTSDNDFASFIIERTRLSLDYSGENLTARLNAQHSGTWGSKEGGSFNVYEAWVKLHDKGFFAQIGRQNLSYDDQRIFGSDDWSMTGTSHDALRLGYEGHGHRIHIMGAFNQNPENMNGGTYFSGGLQPYKAMEAAWYHYDFPGINLGGSLLFMNVGMQGGTKGVNQKTYQQQLYGTYWTFSPKGWKAEAAYYHQSGYEEHGLPVDAWMASGKLAFSPTPALTTYAGYDYLSGDEDFAVPASGMIGMSRHTVINGFSSIYGSHHKFYGAMDFFYVTTYYGGFTPGLQNIFAGVSWKPLERLTTDLSYHFLATATKLSNADRPLGHEIEFAASYDFFKCARLSLGCSYMRGTETMVLLKRTDSDRQLFWAWVMLTVRPRLFSR